MDVIQLLNDTLNISYAITVTIVVRTRIDLVNSGVMIPRHLRGNRIEIYNQYKNAYKRSSHLLKSLSFLFDKINILELQTHFQKNRMGTFNP